MFLCWFSRDSPNLNSSIIEFLGNILTKWPKFNNWIFRSFFAVILSKIDPVFPQVVNIFSEKPQNFANQDWQVSKFQILKNLDVQTQFWKAINWLKSQPSEVKSSALEKKARNIEIYNFLPPILGYNDLKSQILSENSFIEFLGNILPI